MNKILAYLLAVYSFGIVNALANTYEVDSAQALEAIESLIQAGDTIYLRSGNWSNVTLSLTLSGSNTKKINIKNHLNSPAIFTGETNLRIYGSHIVLNGLKFRDVKKTTQNSSIAVLELGKPGENCDSCRLTRAKFDNSGHANWPID